MNKLKTLPATICCLIAALWSEAQCMDQPQIKGEDGLIRNHLTEIPTGSIVSFAGEIAPHGWLMCDGQQYSNQKYPELYEVVREKYVPKESWVIEANKRSELEKYFCVPDLRGRDIILTYIISTGKGNRQQQASEAQQQRLIEVEGLIKQEILAIREPIIDECINLYKSLIRFTYTYAELGKFFDRLKELYASRSYNKEGHGTTTGKYIEELKIRINRTEVDWLNSYKADNRTFSHQIDYSGGLQIMEVANAIKYDLCESMELYKAVHGRIHPRWDEISKM